MSNMFNTVETVLAELAKLGSVVVKARQAAEASLSEADAKGQAAEAAEVKAKNIRAQGLGLQRELERALGVVLDSPFASEEVKKEAKMLVVMATGDLEVGLVKADNLEIDAIELREEREEIKASKAVQMLLVERRATKQATEDKQRAAKKAKKAEAAVHERRTRIRIKAIAALNRFDLAEFSSQVAQARQAGYEDLVQTLETMAAKNGR